MPLSELFSAEIDEEPAEIVHKTLMPVSYVFGVAPPIALVEPRLDARLDALTLIWRRRPRARFLADRRLHHVLRLQVDRAALHRAVHRAQRGHQALARASRALRRPHHLAQAQLSAAALCVLGHLRIQRLQCRIIQVRVDAQPVANAVPLVTRRHSHGEHGHCSG